ncbi:hypothetical protein [Phaeobacter inhibens]|uniref:hypothetical protein n=1 Tax=Phaeobacter inhibens TaxID=221822 RepID=UPI0021A72F25|nr:hypothetical protein [Phaeobacter inhibens]
MDDHFYRVEFPTVIRKLGYVSSKSRKILLGRHVLRSLGLRMAEFSEGSPEPDIDLLRILRVLQGSQLPSSEATELFSAPYTPNDRPEEISLTKRKSHTVASVSFFGGGSSLHFPQSEGHHSTFTNETSELLHLADRIFSREVRDTTKSTNLSTKRIVDERSASLVSDPLWPSNTDRSVEFSDQTIALFYEAEHISSDWSFWREWYQGFLDGKPLDWELQRRVALIDDAIWDAGPEAVATEIERIKTEFLAEKLPMAEIIELNPETGKFRAVPIPVENASYMSALLSQIGDALEDCLGGHNGLSDRSGDVRKLNRVLTKYKDDPQNAELTLTRVAGSLRGQLHDSRELPDNEDNLALLNAVEEGVRGIRANHPEVAANREQLARQAFQTLAAEEKQVLEEALPILTAISEAELAEEFAQDIPELINDATLPLANGAPPLPGADAATRVFSRVSKMTLLKDQYDTFTRKGAEWFDSDTRKTVQLAGLVGGGVIAIGVKFGPKLLELVQIGLRLLGVL